MMLTYCFVDPSLYRAAADVCKQQSEAELYEDAAIKFVSRIFQRHILVRPSDPKYLNYIGEVLKPYISKTRAKYTWRQYESDYSHEQIEHCFTADTTIQSRLRLPKAPQIKDLCFLLLMMLSVKANDHVVYYLKKGTHTYLAEMIISTRLKSLTGNDSIHKLHQILNNDCIKLNLSPSDIEWTGSMKTIERATCLFSDNQRFDGQNGYSIGINLPSTTPEQLRKQLAPLFETFEKCYYVTSDKQMNHMFDNSMNVTGWTKIEGLCCENNKAIVPTCWHDRFLVFAYRAEREQLDYQRQFIAVVFSQPLKHSFRDRRDHNGKFRSAVCVVRTDDYHSDYENLTAVLANIND